MACIQSESLRQNAREEYTKERLHCLAPPDPDADTIPDAEFVEGSCRPIVAEKDGTVVGWGSIHLSENTLAATFVDPDHTGEGIGRTLVEQLENIARKEDVEQFTVPASLNAVGFYETLGSDIRVSDYGHDGLQSVFVNRRFWNEDRRDELIEEGEAEDP